jgi:MscS family membrane protein
MLPRLLAAFTVALALAPTQAISGQVLSRQPASGTEQARPESLSDRLGRSTPRGTVFGFLSAARSGDNATAAQYLNTKLSRKDAEDLAQQLFVILDTRLPARLTQLSTDPEGSRTGALGPDRELVGTIARDSGDVPIVVERVASGSSGYVWLFARTTLAAVPDLYEEVSLISIDAAVPQFLVRTRFGGLRLFDWLAVLLGLPLLYLLMVLLNRLLSPAIAMAWRGMSGRSGLTGRDLLPTPARLILLAIAVHWLASVVRLPLFARQFWFSTSVLIAIASSVWLGILFNGVGEQLIRRRLGASHMTAVASLLRLARRFADIIVIFVGVLVLFRRLSIDPTPALAGLGVGGIAVALAAQKTLENVIGGMSLIFDRAVTEGDFLKVGDTVGSVDHVGLRSTRIRTLDRTVVTVPNSQIANMSLETLSARDTFWFHPIVGLRYETTSEQLKAILSDLRALLADRTDIDQETLRVRFVRMNVYSLDVEIFAYLRARDWDHFLELQEPLLFAVMEIVRNAGTDIAFPSQTLYTTLPQPAAEPPSRAS